MPRAPVDRMIERLSGRSVDEILRDQADRRLSVEQAAVELGISANTLRAMLYARGGRVIRSIWFPDAAEPK